MDKKQSNIEKIHLSSEEKKILEKILQEEIKNFGKQTLTKYIDSKCSRQLFLSFAIKNPDWIAEPSREIIKRIPTRTMSNFIPKHGKIYEQKIYNHLIKLTNIRATKFADLEEISHSELTFELFNDIYNELQQHQQHNSLLLEHQYITPLTFLKDIFTLQNSKLDIPKYSNQRPDILVIRKIEYDSTHPTYELLKGGKFREVSKDELKIKFAINIIDIKNIAEINVGKKHYLEILYYLWTLTYFISDNQLCDKFFIYLEGNGIFPRYNDDEIEELSDYSELFNKIIKIRWRESIRLIKNSLTLIKSIWKQSPCSIESIPVNISVACGYCPFLEDCKTTLGMDGIKEPKDWSLKLIPYTSPSIAQQLESMGFTTIDDLLLNIHKIKIGNTPEALYPELPLLRIKALAIKVNAKSVYLGRE